MSVRVQAASVRVQAARGAHRITDPSRQLMIDRNDRLPPDDGDDLRARLRSLSSFLEQQLDDIKSMPLENVLDELHRFGIDEKAVIERTRNRLAALDERQPEASSDTSARKARSGRLVTAAVATAATVLLVYALLWGTGHLFQSPAERMASLAPVHEELRHALSDVDGRSDDVSAGDFRVAEAISLLLSARRSTLGLFPHYDSTSIERAVDLLQSTQYRASAIRPSDGARTPEVVPTDLSALLLAKAYLMRGDVARARVHLVDVADQSGSAYRGHAVEVLAALPDDAE